MPSSILLLIIVSTVLLISVYCSTTTHDSHYYSTLIRSNKSKVIDITFSVKQKNLDELEKILYEVSDPKSVKYGKYLNRDAVAVLTANPEATSKITTFLKAKNINISRITLKGEYITASATVEQFEELFKTELFTFEHTSKIENKRIERASKYTLPFELQQYVEAVFNLINLPVVQRPAPFKKLRDNPDASSDVVIPSLINDYYNVTTNKGSKFVSQAVFESLDQNYSPSDLKQFQSLYNLPEDTVDSVIGGHDDDSACISDANNCVEANLDVQYLMGLSYFTPTTYYYEDATDSFLAWIQGVSDMENPPLVNSISYGAIEPSLPKFIVDAFNTEAQKLGVQGVTIVVSSGDDGVANFQARGDASKCGYAPSFPATSPFVLAVGATQGAESNKPEIACTSTTGGIVTTGGGFSTKFSAPSYQQSTIAAYFAGLSAEQQPVSGYSTTGRGYPDISMAGYNYEVVVAGQVYAVSGTSASAPVIASFISLVNAERYNLGLPALGFVNPALYSVGSSITHDITSGENNCAASSLPKTATCCTQGFFASAGWDPLTGFGSLDFESFKATFISMGTKI